jgi:hypothetical protein
MAGIHTLTVSVQDAAGNSNSASVSFSVFIASNLYLQGSASALTLNSTSPVSTTPKYVDSPSINRTTFKEIGTWRYVVQSGTSVKLDGLNNLDVWVGLKNSDDQGTNFDVRAEIFKNENLVASGETINIQGVTRNPDKAKEVVISFGDISSTGFNTGDVISLKILTKVTNTGGHGNAVGLRLYYDAISRPANFAAMFMQLAAITSKVLIAYDRE